VRGEKSADVTAGLREFVSKVLEEGSVPVKHSVSVLSESECFYQDPSDPWVQSLEALCGAPAEIATYGTNASMYNHAMAKAMVILGPGSIAQVRMRRGWPLGDCSTIARFTALAMFP